MTLALRLVVLLSLLTVAAGAQAQAERSFMLPRLDLDRFHDADHDGLDVGDVDRNSFNAGDFGRDDFDIGGGQVF